MLNEKNVEELEGGGRRGSEGRRVKDGMKIVFDSALNPLKTPCMSSRQQSQKQQQIVPKPPIRKKYVGPLFTRPSIANQKIRPLIR